ncbi:MAG TPA: hypothetical protein DCX19_03160 [Alphaproteobacteria bacterium]|nr:hypothetical protein [Alphaproteobacteria bacterium]
MSFKKQFKELLANKSLSENEMRATIDALLSDGIDPAVLLYMAVEDDHLPAVKYLRELGADPALIVTDGKNPVSLAIDLDKWEIVEYFLSKDFNRSMIFAGVESLSPLMIDYLESKYVKVPHELKNGEDLDWVNQIN